MKLEELARHASTDARVSVAHLEAPPIGERPPRRSLAPIVAGVAVTALVVGGLAAIARDRSGDGNAPSSADSVLPSVVEVPRLGLRLDGWTVSFAGSLADLNGDTAVPTFTYYGAGRDDDPYADGDLLISSYRSADPTVPPAIEAGEDTIELRGTTATISSGIDLGLPAGATSLTWREELADGTLTEIMLISRSADADELQRIAAGLTVDPATSTITPAADVGLERLAVAAGTPFDAMRGAGEGYIVAYERRDPADFVVISTARGRLEDETIATRWWTGDVTDVEIDGRPGTIATFGERMSEVGPLLTWSPVDGVVATLSHFGADDTLDPATIAATAFEIDDATWQSYLAAADASTAGADEFDEIFGQGEGTVGDTDYTWILGLQGDNLCFNLQVGNEGNGSCQDRAAIDVPAGGARTIDNAFGPDVADVVIAADPAVDLIREVEGRYEISRVDADGLAWFVAVGDASVQPSFEIVVDGDVVGTVEAGVEAAEEVQSLGDIRAAVELGIENMEILMNSGSNTSSWWIGRNGDDLCLVTDGPEPSAGCLPVDDVVVFPPVPYPDDLVTFVVIRDRPDCMATLDIDGTVSEPVVSGGDEQSSYDVWIADATGAGPEIRLNTAGGGVTIDLPDGDGSVPYPRDVCG